MIKRFAVVLTITVTLLIPASTYAFNFFGSACNVDTQNTAACADNTGANPLTGPNGLIIKIADIIAFIAGGAAVILLIIGAIRFITSGGNAENVAGARKTVTGALIGIAVIVLARALIVFVLNHLKT